MRVEKGHINIYRLTLSSYELAALISSARWIAEGAQGELTSEAVDNLKQLLANYDKATKKLNQKTPIKESIE